MFCYKDMTFCTFEDCKFFSNRDCFRALTKERVKQAFEWWENSTQFDPVSSQYRFPPIATFVSKPECYKENDVLE